MRKLILLFSVAGLAIACDEHPTAPGDSPSLAYGVPGAPADPGPAPGMGHGPPRPVVIDFETPALSGWTKLIGPDFVDEASGVRFTPVPIRGWTDIVIGLTPNELTSACVPGDNRDQTLGTGRGEILGFSGLVGAGRSGTDECESACGGPPRACGLVIQQRNQFVDRGLGGRTELRESLRCNHPCRLVIGAQHYHEPGHRRVSAGAEIGNRLCGHQRADPVLSAHQRQQQAQRELGVQVDCAPEPVAYGDLPGVAGVREHANQPAKACRGLGPALAAAGRGRRPVCGVAGPRCERESPQKPDHDPDAQETRAKRARLRHPVPFRFGARAPLIGRTGRQPDR